MARSVCNATRIMRQMMQQRGTPVVSEEPSAVGTFLRTVVPTMEVLLVKGVVFNASILMTILELWQQRGIVHGILVHPGTATYVTKKILENVSETLATELFPFSHVQTNITQHYLVPAHRKLSVAKREQLLTRVPVRNLPILNRTDPVARFFWFQSGDIVEIRRRDGVVAYRSVNG
jgi:DNA-directed RNA polymerase subunit H (RpoH/RPB5)